MSTSGISVCGITYAPIKLTVPRRTKDEQGKIPPAPAPPLSKPLGSRIEQLINGKKSLENPYPSKPKELSDLPNHPSRITSSSSIGAQMYETLRKEPFATEIKYQVSDKLASNYMKDQKDRKIGTLGGLPKTKLDLDALQDIVKRSKYETKVRILTLCGAPGSAKSTSTRELALKLGAFDKSCSITVICPRAEQRKDWERLTNLSHTRDYLIKTFETPFYQPCADTVIIEECGQMPPGWFDALLKSSPHIKYVFILGDPEQNFHYVSNNSAMTFNELNCFESIIKDNKINYKNESYRLSKPQCDIKGTKCLSKVTTFPVSEVKKFDAALPVLTTSEARQRALANQGFRENFTYQSAQGKDFKWPNGEYQMYQMELTKDCLNMEERVFYTAVTRSRAGLLVKFEDEKTKRMLEEYSVEVPSLRFIFDQLYHERARSEYSIQKLPGSSQLRHLEFERSWTAVQNHCERLRAQVKKAPQDYPKHEYPNFQFDLCKYTCFKRFSTAEYSFLARSMNHHYEVLAEHARPSSNKPCFRQMKFGWNFH